MKTILPFRHEDEKNFLNKIHPVIRLILPFIFVVPFLILDDIFLIYTILLITLTIILIFRINLIRILSRLKSIIPFILLITIFLPLYVGETIAFQINFGIKINIYSEGISLAYLMFFRIFGSVFVFMAFFSTLTYSEFIEALTKLRFPSLFVGSFIIMLHYIPILANSNRKILEAQELRGKKITTYWQKLKTHAFIMGKTIVMNMERSEKLYESLKMRGFSGKLTFVSKRIKISDISILAFFFTLTISLIFFINLELIYKGVFALFLL